MTFEQVIESAVGYESLAAFGKGKEYLERYDNIACAVSGGSDSDIMVDMVVKLDKDRKVKYVFFDTGIEYAATKKHLDFLETKYDIIIERVRATKTVPASCMEHGIPWFSKYVSDMMGRLQHNGFQWEDDSFEVLIKKYPRCTTALKWWCNANGASSGFNISRNKLMKEFIMSHPPQFKISDKCCKYAKKMPSEKYCKDNGIDLLLLGLRRSENGIRSKAYKSCFSEKEMRSEWRPLFWITNEEKLDYKTHNNITFSDCYEVYGLKRTGCFGCPFASGFENELALIERYEPHLFLAANNIFGKSYEYMRMYRKFKEEMK